MATSVQLANDCGCCGSDCAKQCQYMSGTATMIGIPEYATPSSPPKLYRRQTLGGLWCASDRDGDCSAHLWNQDQETYEGSYLYDKTTGVVTNTQVGKYGVVSSYTYTPCGSRGVRSVETMPLAFVPWTPPPPHVTLEVDKVSKKWTYDGVCFTISGSLSRTTDGVVTADLDQEDTEADALARAKAAGGTWQHQTGYSCLGLASYQTARGNGFTWDWVQVQHRTEVPAYDPKHPDQTYDVYLWWYTTAGGAGAAIVSEGYSFVNFKPDSVNTTTLWYDIPIPEVGLFAYSGICKVRAA